MGARFRFATKGGRVSREAVTLKSRSGNGRVTGSGYGCLEKTRCNEAFLGGNHECTCHCGIEFVDSRPWRARAGPPVR